MSAPALFAAGAQMAANSSASSTAIGCLLAAGVAFVIGYVPLRVAKFPKVAAQVVGTALAIAVVIAIAYAS